MARFENGWVAVSRRIFVNDQQANPFYGDIALAGLWILLISWANVRETKQRRGSEDTVVGRGCLITSQGELGEATGLSRQKLRTLLAYLVKTEKINLVSNRRGLHITVINYERYQNANPVDNQAVNPNATKSQPECNQELTRTQPLIEQSNKRTREQENKDISASRRTAGREAKSKATWEAYRTAYYLTHGAEPLPNAGNRSMACRLVDALGAADAPEVAEYYVLNERASWILQARHPFGELLKNSQKYHTNWKTKTKVTEATAKSAERDDSNEDAINRYLARKHAAQPIAGG